MSFILDALKKIEDEKNQERRSGGLVRQEGGRRFGESKGQLLFALGSTALAVAAVALLAYAWLQFKSDGRGDALATGAVMSLPGGSAASAGSEGAAARPADVPSAPIDPPPQKNVVPAMPEASESPVVSKEPSSGAEEPAEPVEDTPSADPDAEPEVLEAVPAVRLVGRDSTAEIEAPESYLKAETSDAPEIENPTLDGDVETTLEGEDSLNMVAEDVLSQEEPPQPEPEVPDGLPELVLQGTSVLDGKPVAVVNEQRVFEGDIVDGVRILRIMERAVELEFQGYRFTIQI